MDAAVRFFRNSEGVFAAPGSGLELLATLLQTDLQDEQTTQDLLADITRARRMQAGFSFSGNAHSLEIDRNGTLEIQSLFDETILPLTMDCRSFTAILEQWRAFLADPSLQILLAKF